MHIKDHVKVALPVVAVDQATHGVYGGLAEAVGVVPVAVEVLAQQVAHGIAEEHPVRVHHWHQFEDQVPENGNAAFC